MLDISGAIKVDSQLHYGPLTKNEQKEVYKGNENQIKKKNPKKESFSYIYWRKCSGQCKKMLRAVQENAHDLVGILLG